MPKLIASLLVYCLILLMAGCGKSNSNASSQEFNDTAAKDQSAEKLAPTPAQVPSPDQSAVSQNVPLTNGRSKDAQLPPSSAPSPAPSPTSLVTAPSVPAAQAQVTTAPPTEAAKPAILPPTPAAPLTAPSETPLASSQSQPKNTIDGRIQEVFNSALGELNGAINTINTMSTDGIKPTSMGFPDDKMYNDADLTKETRVLNYQALGITTIELNSYMLSGPEIVNSTNNQITITIVAKSHPDMKDRARLLADGVGAKIKGTRLIISEAVSENKCVQMKTDNSFSLRGSCLSEIVIGLPQNSPIDVLDRQGKTIASTVSKPASVADKIRECARTLNVRIFRIVKNTVGLTNTTQLDAVPGLDRSLCIDKNEDAKALPLDEQSSAVYDGIVDAARPTFGAQNSILQAWIQARVPRRSNDPL